MKFIELEPAGNGHNAHKRYHFALGKSEALILLRLLDKGIRYMPRTVRTESTEKRMRNMRRAIGDALPRMKNIDADDYFPIP